MTPREIKQARQQFSGEDRAAFASAMGVSPHTVESWEQGRRTPKAPTVVAIRVLVGLEPSPVAKSPS